MAGKVYTKEEVAKHNTENDCWTIIHNKVYDVTFYQDGHPGGKYLILSVAGDDGTMSFEGMGHSKNAKSILESFYVGDLAGATQVSEKIAPNRFEKTELSDVEIQIQTNPVLSTDTFRKIILLKVEKISSDTSIFTFENPFKFGVGQHLVARIVDNFEVLTRKYTPISVSHETFSMLIKKYEKGPMSTHIHSLKVGDTLDVDAPRGREFTTDVKNVVLIAGGTGITPMISIIPHLEKSFVNISLVFCSGSRENIYPFPKESLKNVRVLLRECDKHHTDPEYYRYTRISEDILVEFLSTSGGATQFCLCGPDGFIETVVKALHTLRFKDKDIHIF